MKHQTHVMTLSCLFTLILTLAPEFSSAGKYNAIMSIGDNMPAFASLPGTDSASLSSTDIKESVVVLVSLANHCPWVKGMDKGLIEVAEKFKDQDVRVVGFSVNHQQADRLPAMKEHARKVGYNFSYIYDESQELGRQLGATRTPEYFVFDKDRKLVYTGLLYDSPARMDKNGAIKRINGEPKTFYVENAIAAVLAGRVVDPSETRAHGCGVKYEKKI